MGGFKAQGLTCETALPVIKDALAVEKAGAFSLLVEAVPPEVTEIITQKLKIPVLSIGAGPLCDGQLLLDIDLLGKSEVFTPKFVKDFIPQTLMILQASQVIGKSEPVGLAEITLQAFKEYVREVKAKTFPDIEKHCYKMKEGELEKLKAQAPFVTS